MLSHRTVHTNGLEVLDRSVSEITLGLQQTQRGQPYRHGLLAHVECPRHLSHVEVEEFSSSQFSDIVLNQSGGHQKTGGELVGLDLFQIGPG